MSTLEQKAIELDEIRKARILRSNEIDVDKYLAASDISLQVKNASDWLEQIRRDYIAPPEAIKCQMPWTKTHGEFSFRPGEVTVYAGANGHGKSLITGQIALYLVKQGAKVCIASFEMKPERTLHRMLRQFSGEFIDDPMTRDKAKYIESLTYRFDALIGENLWLYDQQGSTNPKIVIAMARYCAVELGIQHIFIDSLMKCVNAEDDYNQQKYFVDELTALARDHNVHIHLIHHVRKLQSEEIAPNKNDLKGSGSIADQVDNVLIMWRNKKKSNMLRAGDRVDPAMPDAYLMCEKQRNGEAEEMYALWFNAASQQFVEDLGLGPMDFDNRGQFVR